MVGTKYLLVIAGLLARPLRCPVLGVAGVEVATRGGGGSVFEMSYLRGRQEDVAQVEELVPVQPRVCARVQVLGVYTLRLFTSRWLACDSWARDAVALGSVALG